MNFLALALSSINGWLALLQASMRKSSEETGLYWGTKPRSMTLGVRDLAFVGTGVAGIAAAFISRRKARQTDLRTAALLQSLEERNRTIKSLEEEQAKILSQLNDASTKAGISDSTCSDLRAELEGVQKQLTQKAQEHELTIQKIENERDQAKLALEVGLHNPKAMQHENAMIPLTLM